MRITQGTFSFLPDLTDEEIRAQIDYMLAQGWACGVEYTDDPHPRNTFWEMWGPPMFDLKDAAGILTEVVACRNAHPESYIKLTAFDSTRGFETIRLSFIVQRPATEAGFALDRIESAGRSQRYAMRRKAADGQRG
jgi:ribulose-bisphosphate carboxylase small chain